MGIVVFAGEDGAVRGDRHVVDLPCRCAGFGIAELAEEFVAAGRGIESEEGCITVASPDAVQETVAAHAERGDT